MKRSELEKYLGKKVKVKLDDGSVLTGKLYKTDVAGRPNYYYCEGNKRSWLFKSSYIKRLEEIKDGMQRKTKIRIYLPK